MSDYKVIVRRRQVAQFLMRRPQRFDLIVQAANGRTLFLSEKYTNRDDAMSAARIIIEGVGELVDEVS